MKEKGRLYSAVFMVLLVCYGLGAHAQFRVGIEFSKLWDADWNRGLIGLPYSSQPMQMSSSIPIVGGIRGEYVVGRFAPFLRTQFLNRRMELYRFPRNRIDFVHNTLEFAAGVAYYQPISKGFKFFAAIGGGFDVLVSGLSKLSGEYTVISFFDEEQLTMIDINERFSIVNSNKLVWSGFGRIGIENDLGKWGGLQIWTELHLQFSGSYSYELIYPFVDAAIMLRENTKEYKTNYGAAGISWVIPFKRKAEQKEE